MGLQTPHDIIFHWSMPTNFKFALKTLQDALYIALYLSDKLFSLRPKAKKPIVFCNFPHFRLT